MRLAASVMEADQRLDTVADTLKQQLSDTDGIADDCIARDIFGSAKDGGGFINNHNNKIG